MKVKDLVKEVGSKRILGPISFEFKDKKIYGIIGKSGAGKTTLLKCLVGLDKNYFGTIDYKNAGFIAQSYSLLERKTVIDNVMIGFDLLSDDKSDRFEALKRATELLDYVQISQKKDEYPSKLSGGEKQRVAIARALLMDPEILICDEFTSALDPKTSAEILNLIKDLNKTTIFVTHDFEVVKNFADFVCVLDKGILIEHGKTAEVFKSPKHPLTSLMINEHYKISLPDHWVFHKQKEEGDESLYKLDFLDSKATAPIISWLVFEFNVPVNIVSGSLDYIQNEPVGHLVISVPSDFDLKKALADKNISIEFIGYIKWN